MPLSTVATLPSPLQRPGIWVQVIESTLLIANHCSPPWNPLLSPLTPLSPDTGWIL